MPARVIVGMSGGVDSSVSAALLVEQGYRVEGLFMRNWEEDDEQAACTAAQDLIDAAAVCERLGIPLHTANFSAEYRESVFRRFLDELGAGRTPNPDVLCNREIKFGHFLRHADSLGADWIATGHYARVDRRDGSLLKGADPDKDQAYFLHSVADSALARTLFPLGAMSKSATRALAAERGLANHAKKDSVGICFIGQRPFAAFVSRYLPPRPGRIVDLSGRAIGEHRSVAYYTWGQRRGLGIGGGHGDGQAWYVAGKHVGLNELLAVPGHDHPALHHRALRAEQLRWRQDPSTAHAAKIRHRQADQACAIEQLSADGTRCLVRFERPQWAVSPGQAVVFYDGERCVGGGVIESAQWPMNDCKTRPSHWPD